MNRLCRSALLGGALCLVLGVASVAVLAQGGGPWVVKGMIPYDRAEIALATMNGKIYVISGQSRGVDANEFTQEYDPATGNWRELALMPAIASHAGAVALNGKIYVVGGFLASVHLAAVDRVFSYDPAADQWKALAPLSVPRGSAGVIVLDGKIHAIGGRDPQLRTISTHEVYDPATDKWTMAAALPIGRDHFGIAVLGGKIHAFGGRTGGQTDRVGRHDVYDPATDTWTTAAPLLTPRSAGVYFVQNNHIVYAGGECKDTTTGTTYNEAEVYDPAANKWTALPSLPAGRHAGAAIVVGDTAYVIGGNNGCGANRPAKEILAFRLPAS
jgi:N-acetylneuraminic acid mutarotase